MLKKILITGANGFIAKTVARTLKEAGCFVIGTSRNTTPVEGYDVIVKGVLGEPLEGLFEQHRIDAVVHCAYDKDEQDNRNNAEGTYKWAEQAEAGGVDLQVFFSSLSADENAASSYGLKKYEVEEWFLTRNHVVLRPGLVAGPGGLFRRIISTVEKSPAIPLIDGGKTLVYLSDVDVLSEMVRDAILEGQRIERGKILFVQQETPYFFVDILKQIRKQCGLFCVLVPIPYSLVSLVLTIVEKMKFLKLGINTNNLKGMRQLNDKKFRSDVKVLGYSETSLETLIRKSLD